MSLINCPECGRENVSDSAVACPGCGFGIKQYIDEKKYHDENQNLGAAVTDIIKKIGVPTQMQGYQYLRMAIIQSIEDKEMLQSVTKKLYPAVAKYFFTTPTRVERGIRHAIEVAWDRGDLDTLNSIFGNTVNTMKRQPTNSEFITVIVNKLTMH